EGIFNNAKAEEYHNDPNVSKKVLPYASDMYEAMKKYVTETNKREEVNLFLSDTSASLKRLFLGVMIASVLSLFIGVGMGVFPWIRALMNGIVTTFSIVPPVSLVPILFVLAGTGEPAKIFLIVFGTCFLKSRDVARVVSSLPNEQLVTTLTLGGNPASYIIRIVLPQLLPRFLEMVKIYLGPAWIFVIVSEGLGASSGLAHRMYLLRRSYNLALMFPIVMWITLVAILLNVILILFSRWKCKWFATSNNL
ncbi:ABC transporter permease subunit, partial [Candidatus Kuenenbacteria bacterium]|nr:ABC transporter permease subunit [Candidatus Kuenenbacteria bacterium]